MAFKKSHNYKVLNRAVGKALHLYNMISDGDRIAVGLSGGKDSLSLMRILRDRQAYVPIRYKLFGIFIDPGFPGSFGASLEKYCCEKSDYLRVEYTQCGMIGHSPQNRENPCFLCSKLRRKQLFEVSAELGCNKLALGHNKDDIIETLFLNICYGGEISTMVPSQSFFNGKLRIIRPLAHVDEDTIRRFATENKFPEFVNPCPTAKVTKRQEIKELLHSLYRNNKKVKGNIFRSMSHVKSEYLLK